MTAELRDAGSRVNRKRVERVMRVHGIVGVHLRRRVCTTVPDPAARTVPDLIRRDFTAAEPNRRYVGDITLPVDGGEFLYLATVIDLCSRRLAGWSIADHMRTELDTDALEAAARTRGNLDGAVFHSDAGQHTSVRFAESTVIGGITPSIGTVGDAYDNALAETTIGLYKTECIRGDSPFRVGPLETRTDVEQITSEWVHWYNTERLMHRLGRRPPAEAEEEY